MGYVFVFYSWTMRRAFIQRIACWYPTASGTGPPSFHFNAVNHCPPTRRRTPVDKWNEDNGQRCF